MGHPIWGGRARLDVNGPPFINLGRIGNNERFRLHMRTQASGPPLACCKTSGEPREVAVRGRMPPFRAKDVRKRTPTVRICPDRLADRRERIKLDRVRA